MRSPVAVRVLHLLYPFLSHILCTSSSCHAKAFLVCERYSSVAVQDPFPLKKLHRGVGPPVWKMLLQPNLAYLLEAPQNLAKLPLQQSTLVLQELYQCSLKVFPAFSQRGQ